MLKSGILTIMLYVTVTIDLAAEEYPFVPKECLQPVINQCEMEPDCVYPMLAKLNEQYAELATCPQNSDPCTLREKAVKIASANTPAAYRENYSPCARPMLDCLKHRALGVTYVGGPDRRCIDIGPKRTGEEWFVETGGTCQAKDSKSKRWRNSPQYDSEPLDNKCSGPGPRKTRWEMFTETNGSCRVEGYLSLPSSHAFGRGIDYAIRKYNPDRFEAPDAKALLIGNSLRDWIIEHHKIYHVENIIWNKKIYSQYNNWQGIDYFNAAAWPHYDHVHVEHKPCPAEEKWGGEEWSNEDRGNDEDPRSDE